MAIRDSFDRMKRSRLTTSAILLATGFLSVVPVATVWAQVDGTADAYYLYCLGRMHEMEMEEKRQTISAIKAQAAESNARANKYKVEAELEPRKVENERIDAVADVRDGVTEAQFSRRLKVAETKLKERDLNIREKDIDLRRENEKSAQKMLHSND